MDRHTKPSDQFTQKPRDLNADLLADIRREEERRSTPNFEEDPLHTIEREDRLKRAGLWQFQENPREARDHDDQPKHRAGRDIDIIIERPDPDKFVRREIFDGAQDIFSREIVWRERAIAMWRFTALVMSGATIVVTIVSIVLWFSARS
jgi:hypothetical protein